MDISFNGNNQYRLTHDGEQYVLYKKRRKKVNVVGSYRKLESVLDAALFCEIADSDAHSFANVYAAIEDAKEFIRGVASKLEETCLNAA